MGIFSPTCPVCGGNGKEVRWHHHDAGRDGSKEHDFKTESHCSACHGTGKVAKVWTETEEVKHFCQRCAGTGKETVWKTFPDGTNRKGTDRKGKCSACGGKGTWTTTHKQNYYRSPS